MKPPMNADKHRQGQYDGMGFQPVRQTIRTGR
jgi:hypothetical protein